MFFFFAQWLSFSQIILFKCKPGKKVNKKLRKKLHLISKNRVESMDHREKR